MGYWKVRERSLWRRSQPPMAAICRTAKRFLGKAQTDEKKLEKKIKSLVPTPMMCSELKSSRANWMLNRT
jgi:hypothetical protein